MKEGTTVFHIYYNPVAIQILRLSIASKKGVIVFLSKSPLSDFTQLLLECIER